MTQTLTDGMVAARSAAIDQGLDHCAVCGHSRRNHEDGGGDCARSLCDCSTFASG